MTAFDENKNELRVYPLNSSTPGIKMLGERYLASDTQINCDWTGSGFEMDIEHDGGEITFTASASANCFFRAYVDGKAWEGSDYEIPVYFLVKPEVSRITLSDVPAGKHRIKLIKVSGYTLARAQVTDVSLCGTICEQAPDRKPLYIEFVGDSICCGWGIIGERKGTYTDQDGTLAYPLKIAAALDADYSVTALSGQGLIFGPACTVTEGYRYASPLRSKSEEYDFARKADIVVINIGTNDYGHREQPDINAETFKASYLAFLNTVIEKNGKDCKIYCLYKTMNDTFHEVLLEACEEFGKTVRAVVPFEMTRSAGGQHPTIEENVKYTADVLRLLVMN
jgi:lysophospholipase L1-like esterase